MAAVTQVIPNFLGGVSKQTDQKKLPGQVRDCLNAYPDPTFGLMKRPGFKFIDTIYTPASGTDPELKDGKWFFIKRDDDEIYIGCILDSTESEHSTNPIRIWNKAGTEVTGNITYPNGKTYLNTTHDNYDVLTVQDTSIITNKTKICKPATAPISYVSDSYGTLRLMNIAYSNRYMVKVKVGGTLYGTNYTTSIKYIGKSTKLVDTDRTEGNYLDIAASSTTTSGGSGAKFNVTVNSSGGTTVSLKNRGTGYAKGDKFTFTDATLGGEAAAKTIEVSSGATGASGRTSGTYTVAITDAMTSSNGEDAEIRVTIANDTDKTASATLIEGGKTFAAQETITITSSELTQIGSTDLVLKVTEIKAAKDLTTEVLELNDDVTDLIAAQYYTINAEDNTPQNQVSTPADEKYLTANRILKQLKAGLEATTLPTNHVWEITQLDATLEVRIKNTGPDPDVYVAFELITSDSQGNFSIESFNEDVNSVADLPAQAMHGRIVRVVNSGPADTTYWSKFTAEDGVSGKGYWEESIDPTVSTGLDKTTMPHELFNSSANNFIFRQADWTNRTVGDDATNAHPGFILEDASSAGEYLRTIQQCFYHNNRLGILTDDNVVMSKSGDFFNFYYTSALTILDSDPIDINCSSLRPAVLHAVIPTAQGLLLFSRNQQFIMFSDAEILTPSSAIIRGISNYEMDATIDPVESGTLLNFVSKTPSSTRVFSVHTRGSEESPDILDIGKIVSGWIPQTTKNLISSPQNSLIALYGDNSTTGTIGSPTIYIYKTYIVGEKMVMQAWVKWDLPGNVQHVSIDADIMYVVIENSGKYVLCSTNLTEAPEETILTTKDGRSINPYMDMYATASSVTYDTSGDFSKCYLPYDDITDETPVIILKGDASAGEVAGFTLSPESTKDAAWQASTAYAVGDVVSNDSDKVYTCDTAGTSAGSGGPTGTGANITDGSARWDYTRTGSTYFKVPEKNWTATGENIASKVVVGYQYNYDVELPKTYFKLNPEGTQYDYTASLTVARMKFALGLSSVCSFKVTSKGYIGDIWEGTMVNAKSGTSGKSYEVSFLLKEENGIKVTLDGARQASTAYTVTSTDTQSTVNFTSAPLGHTVKQLFGGTGYTTGTDVATTSSGDGTGLTVDTTVAGGVITAVAVNSQGTGYKPNEVITVSGGTISATFLIKTLPQAIAITTDTWYDVQPSSDADQYLADDVPLLEENIFTIPIHQRSENFSMRVFSNSPFPVSLTSMMWEGQYSPRFYRRT